MEGLNCKRDRERKKRKKNTIVAYTEFNLP